MERLDIGAKLWAERHAESYCLQEINAHIQAKFPGQPPIRRATLHLDRKRIRELWADHQGDHRAEHIAALDHLISAAWSAFRETKATSLNRSAYISAIGNLIEKKARLDGSLVERKHITGDGTPVLNVTVMGDEQLAEVVRLSMAHLPRLAGMVGPREPEVIDVEATYPDSEVDGPLVIESESNLVGLGDL